jgi:hypothetical protein
MGNPYSFNCKMVQRSRGQSAVAAAAYQAGEKLRDERTGRKYQYHKKKRVWRLQKYWPRPMRRPGPGIETHCGIK